MNTDITASAKPEYPVIDRNPPFTKTVANFNTLDYLRLSTISGISVTVGYLSDYIFAHIYTYTHSCGWLVILLAVSLNSGWGMIVCISPLPCPVVVFAGIKPGIRGPSMVTGGLIGVMGGFMYAYQNSAGRLMGFFPNDGEVARYKKSKF
ncbi:hypothetical protein CTI12_AA017790 [Artemisia annua]|uniref:NADH-ubiquinone oxidoreductase 21kDa subunit N-terminal domain-containing protein n=1 Tax=Artemisia annua TaxID=35608 RepID=A0A2U1QKG2_ARTAN|nr:hypothetical protein CTI12_AA017790 [Artemisia annua]